jgi:hypothetical protein
MSKVYDTFKDGKLKDTAVNMLNLASEILLAKAKKNTGDMSESAAKS